MAKSLQRALLVWGAGLLIFALVAIAVSYFFTSYQANQLNDHLQKQYKQLQRSVPVVPERMAPALAEPPTTDVSSLLTQAAKQHNVDLHYQQNPQYSEQWLVGINGTYQNALRLVASITHAQQGMSQPFPFTQTLTWRDNDQHIGKLSWQFLWLTTKDSAPSALSDAPLFKANFPDVIAEPIECLDKPQVPSDIHLSDWSLLQLVATQTSPLKKALLKIPNHPVLTLTENSWIATPLLQLKIVNKEYAEFERWQKEAGCWSAEPLKLHLTKDNTPQ